MGTDLAFEKSFGAVSTVFAGKPIEREFGAGVMTAQAQWR